MIPKREDLLDYSKVELVDLCDELIKALEKAKPKKLKKIFPKEDG